MGEKYFTLFIESKIMVKGGFRNGQASATARPSIPNPL